MTNVVEPALIEETRTLREHAHAIRDAAQQVTRNATEICHDTADLRTRISQQRQSRQHDRDAAQPA